MATRFTLVLIALSLASALCTANSFQQGKLYKYVDRQGHVRYTDRPQHDGYVELERTWKGWQSPSNYANYKVNRVKFRSLITSSAKEHGLPHWLVSAVIHAESLYNPQAVSRVGAVGLMQLMPGTAQRYGVYNRQDPQQNVDAGVRYLRDLLSMFDDNLDLALAAYNAGENAVKKYGYAIPPYKETRNYVRKVKTLTQRYKSEPI